MDQINQILLNQFPRLIQQEVDKIFEMFRNPHLIGMNSIIFIAIDSRNVVNGFAIIFHELTLNFFYLDYIAVTKKMSNRGIGSALYQRVQQEALACDCMAIFLDCYTDDQRDFINDKILQQNKKRLKFYEEFHVYPIINNKYNNKILKSDYPSFLMIDSLDSPIGISNRMIRIIVKIILEQRYGDISTIDYIEEIINSFEDEIIQVRNPVYIKKKKKPKFEIIPDKEIAIVMSDFQKIHQISHKRYYEVPVDISTIWKELKKSNWFKLIKPREFSNDVLYSIHGPEMVNYIKEISQILDENQTIFPVVFSTSQKSKLPNALIDQFGFYCFDITTPLLRNTFNIAKRAVECALTAADIVRKKGNISYALIYPPGHHAKKHIFGGFCYFNSVAIAAEYLSKFGKITILDIDYHHGSGTQEIFYERNDILTISIHGNPKYEYPFFSGYEDEIGLGEGSGFNINYPIEKNISGEKYLQILDQALEKILEFNPKFLVLAFGLDIAKKDPTSTALLDRNDFLNIGKRIGNLHFPTIVIQEGGYMVRNLGKNAKSFFEGLNDSFFIKKV